MIGQLGGELQPWLLRLRVGGASDVKVVIGPYLSIRVKAGSSSWFLR